MRWHLLLLLPFGCSTRGGEGSSLPPAHEPPAATAKAAPSVKLAESAPHLDRDPFGAGYPAPLAPAPHGRVGSQTWGTWIKPKPSWGALPLGGIRPGATLPLASPERVRALGECAEWVAVERGYVCATRRATLDTDSAFIRAHRWTDPAAGTFPYEYALSVGAPMLTRPVPNEQFVWRVGSRELPRMRGWNEGHDELAEERPIEPNGPIPDFLRDGASAPNAWGGSGLYVKNVPAGTMIAYTRAFEAYGQVWVLSTNLAVVPARGLKRFRRSSFRGVELGSGVELPIAWARKRGAKLWRRGESGFQPSAELAPRSFVQLTGVEARDGSRRLLETRTAGIWVDKREVRRAESVAKPPWEAKGGKWIHIRVERGTLTLYEGARPVFTTLMSPGKEDATPYGRYTIESKHHVTTMTTEMGEPKKFWIADVPWTIYFKRPYAIHAAYWHEDFGERKSGGCVNLSPLDAERVFRWADPELPKGWTSVQAPANGPSPFVLVEG